MKVLIYNADTLSEKIFSMRFRRLGHKVVFVYEDKNTVKGKIDYGKGDIVYQGVSEKKLGDIIRFEAPQMIVWGQVKRIQTEDQSVLNIEKSSILARLSAKYDVKKFLFLSSLDVYGNNFSSESEKEIEPITLHGKTAYTCESIITGFRSEEKYQNIFYRVSDIFGLNEPGEFLEKILESVANNKPFPPELKGQQIIPLYEGDLADAVVKAVSDYIEGVFDLCGENAYTAERIYNMIAERMGKPQLTIKDENAINAPPDCKRALHEIRWLRFYSLEKALEIICQEWTQQKNQPGDVKPKLEKRRNKLQSFAENTGIFLLVAFIQWNLPINIGSDPLLLYVIAAAAVGGISQGIFAAVLVLIYNTYAMLEMGFGLDAIILHHPFLWGNLFYMVVAMIIGYVVERKNIKMKKIEEKAAFIEQDRERVLIMNEELALIKSYHEKKLLGYEGGIERIYKVFLSLEMKSVIEILLKAPSVVKELTGEENVSIYTVQKNSRFLRKLAYIGKPESLVPTNSRYVDTEMYKRIIDYNEFYINKRMDQDMPSIVMPVSINKEVIAVVVIEGFAFEKHTKYYLNMIQISGHIISDFLEKMATQSQRMSKMLFEGDSCIMDQLHFKAVCDTVIELSKDTVFDYSIIEVISEGNGVEDAKKTRKTPHQKDVISRFKNSKIGALLYGTNKTGADILQNGIHNLENAKKIRKALRKMDAIGRLENGKIGILLYGTNKTDADILVNRMHNLGIQSRII